MFSALHVLWNDFTVKQKSNCHFEFYFQSIIVVDMMAGVHCIHLKLLSLVWIGVLAWLCLEIWEVLMQSL